MTQPANRIDAAAIAQDLESGEPSRVRGALESLDHACRAQTYVPLPMPEPFCLEAFGENAPADLISTYFRVVQNYPAFSPGPTPPQMRHAMIEALLRYGRGDKQLVYEFALWLKIDFQPEVGIADAFLYLQRSGFDPDVLGVTLSRLVDNLLDATESRAATIKALRKWVEFEELPSLVAEISPRLSEDERLQLLVED